MAPKNYFMSVSMCTCTLQIVYYVTLLYNIYNINYSIRHIFNKTTSVFFFFFIRRANDNAKRQNVNSRSIWAQVYRQPVLFLQFFHKVEITSELKKMFFIKKERELVPFFSSGVASKGLFQSSLCRFTPSGRFTPRQIFTWFGPSHKLAKGSKKRVCFFLTFSTFLIIKAVYAYYRKFRKKKTNKEEKKKIHINPTKLEEPSLPFLAYFLSAFISKF